MLATMNLCLFLRHYALPWSFRSCSFSSLVAISSAKFSAFRALLRAVSTVCSAASFLSWSAWSCRWSGHRDSRIGFVGNRRLHLAALRKGAHHILALFDLALLRSSLFSERSTPVTSLRHSVLSSQSQSVSSYTKPPHTW